MSSHILDLASPEKSHLCLHEALGEHSDTSYHTQQRKEWEPIRKFQTDIQVTKSMTENVGSRSNQCKDRVECQI